MSKYGYYLGMTPEQQDIVKMIREFAERELDPVVKEYDEKGEFPVQLHEKWGEMGLFGLDVPEQYGGLGLNAVTRYCISEELAKHDAGFTISNNSYSFGLSAILADGTEAQKQAACARILRGEGISMAITEPQSGSDVGIPIGTLGNSLKCFASEMCYDVVNMGLQVFAGYGYSREYPLEKLLRDARIYSIFEGTNQVQRQVIGKTLLG